jgi:hypothetical protein
VLFNKRRIGADESYLRYQLYNLIAEADEADEIVTITRPS